MALERAPQKNTDMRVAPKEPSPYFYAGLSILFEFGSSDATAGPCKRKPASEERDGGMVLRMTDTVTIENPREYAAHIVGNLRHLLTAGSDAQRDPLRQHFYQIEANKSAFYIHISPITGNVILLAKWRRQPQNCRLGAEPMVA
ncbi:MAG TPA: hypothetical protein VNI36_10340 [Candidatus Dormibacteraeota bacterium]|nr:hypothetical protein [Candidatus Dormibacteraeota bacterium]